MQKKKRQNPISINLILNHPPAKVFRDWTVNDLIHKYDAKTWINVILWIHTLFMAEDFNEGNSLQRLFNKLLGKEKQKENWN